MKNDINGCSTTAPGTESYESFIVKGTIYIQYDYRTPEGKLFSTVGIDIETCRRRLNTWLRINGEDMTDDRE